MDIKERLDNSFADEPAQRPVGDRIVAGRRALRRRRAAAGLTALAVAGVIGGTSWLALDGAADPASHRGDRVATSPSDSAPATKRTADYTPSKEDFLGEPALLHDGEVHLARGWTEVKRIDNPMDYPRKHTSVGLEVRKGEEHRFVLLCEFADDSTSTMGSAPVGTLADWLQTSTANQHSLDIDNGVVPPDSVTGPLVTMEADGTLVPRSDVTIVDQVTPVDFGPHFAGLDDDTAAARLDLPEGPDVYVAIRRLDDGRSETIRGGTAKQFPTIDDFVAYAATKYSGQGDEGNEGMR